MIYQVFLIKHLIDLSPGIHTIKVYHTMQIPYNHKNTMWCYIYQYEKKISDTLNLKENRLKNK